MSNVMIAVSISSNRYNDFIKNFDLLVKNLGNNKLFMHANLISSDKDELDSMIKRFPKFENLSIVGNLRKFLPYEHMVNRFFRSFHLSNYSFTEKIDYIYMIDDDFSVKSPEKFYSSLDFAIDRMNNLSLNVFKFSTNKSDNPEVTKLGYPWVASGIILRKPRLDTSLMPPELVDSNFFLDDVIVSLNLLSHLGWRAEETNMDNGLVHNFRMNNGRIINYDSKIWIDRMLGVRLPFELNQEFFRIISESVKSRIE